MKNRIERVNQILIREIGKIIQQELDIEENVLVTVTDIITSHTFEHATVFISVLPTQKGKKILERLRAFIYTIQKELNRKVAFRSVPKITFKLDERESKAQRIDEILQSEVH